MIDDARLPLLILVLLCAGCAAKHPATIAGPCWVIRVPEPEPARCALVCRQQIPGEAPWVFLDFVACDRWSKP